MIKVNRKSLESYSFIDLFAGIGGFHLALSSFGANCVFTSEWDKFSCETYETNFKIKPFGDITKIKEEDIPPHDILCGGFPCQAFSISGKQKGFEDTRGTLFFDIARIVSFHQPKVLFLENVKNLVKHNKGETFFKIIDTLETLGYSVFSKVLNASDFELPQNRERVYIVAFHNSIDSRLFKFPSPIKKPVYLNDFLETKPIDAKVIIRNDIKIDTKFSIESDIFNQMPLINRPIQIGKVNKGGQGERIYHPLGHSVTLSAYGGGVGSKTGLYYIEGDIRKLSPRECARIQGYPDDFVFNSNKNQAYKQFGNSVAINVLQYILIEISKVLNND